MAEKIHNETHRKIEEDRAFSAAEREKKSSLTARKMDAWATLECHGVQPAKVDYRGCKSADESRWLRLGGSLTSFREIFAPTGDDGNDHTQNAALENLKLSLGVAPQPAEPVAGKAYTHFRFSAATTSRPGPSLLDVLHAEYDALTNARAAVGERIIAARIESNRVCSSRLKN